LKQGKWISFPQPPEKVGIVKAICEMPDGIFVVSNNPHSVFKFEFESSKWRNLPSISNDNLVTASAYPSSDFNFIYLLSTTGLLFKFNALTEEQWEELPLKVPPHSAGCLVTLSGEL